MKSSSSAKLIAAAALAVAGFGAVSTAHARSDVYFTVGVQPNYYVEPAPVYVRPRPVYVAPRPVYVAPQPVYEQYGYENDRGWRHDAYRSDHRGWYGDHQRRRFGPYGDRDGDGIVNRQDRFPDNPYRY
ncbi:MAG: PXPV repeat protein [Ramlibacter sp.]